jgi:AraC family transcriptional regulator
MTEREPGRRGSPINPLDWLKRVPFDADAASGRLKWSGLEAVRYRGAPASELSPPAMTHHRFILFARPPEELDLLCDGVKRHVPPPAGSIMLVPAGTPARYRWSGHMDTLNIYLEPGLFGRVATEAFDLDPARLTVPPLDGLDLPHVRAAMRAVDAELASGGIGGRLAAESLANVLAVCLIRHLTTPGRPQQGRDGVLPQRRLRAVIDYVEENLDAGLSLEQMAAAAQLSAYHFARQFKAATGHPPHQYVILRRVERAKQLIRRTTEASLAEVAALAGFSDQSQFTRHFKRLVGATPGQFRAAERIV